MPTFKELGLRSEIVQALDKLGFETPTPIQEKAIPQVLESKKDLIALAQTGTGKTAAFGLPVLEQLDVENRNVQSIILCPTRELCLQIAKDLENFARFIDIKIQAVYGGASIETQIRGLKRGSQVVVGTPGRTVDLINRRVLKLQNVNFVVLDEADEMLTMGFKDDLDHILGQTPETKQTLLFSATMPRGIREIVGKYMTDPAEVKAGGANTGATNVEHHYYQVSARDKYECLKRLADVTPNIYGIVFCRTRRETKEIADKLMQDGYNADALHGDLSQAQRDSIMGRFRKRNLQILVATDVAARGHDVTDLTHVINYNLPDEEEVYIHRSGRTGRAGKSGISIAIIHNRERSKMKAVERKLKKEFIKKMVPTGQEICEKQLYAIVERLDKIEIDEQQIEPFLPAIMEQLGHLSKEDLVKHLVSFEFNKFLNYYKKSRDLNVASNERSDRSSSRRNDRDSRDRGRDSGRDGGRDGGRGSKRSEGFDFERFHINIGKKQRTSAVTLMGLINEQLKKRDVEIGKIEILDTFSFFEIDSAYAEKVVTAFKGVEHDGTVINLTPAKSKGRDTSEKRERKGERKESGNRAERRASVDFDKPRKKKDFRNRYAGFKDGGEKGRSNKKRPF